MFTSTSYLNLGVPQIWCTTVFKCVFWYGLAVFVLVIRVIWKAKMTQGGQSINHSFCLDFVNVCETLIKPQRTGEINLSRTDFYEVNTVIRGGNAVRKPI